MFKKYIPFIFFDETIAAWTKSFVWEVTLPHCACVYIFARLGRAIFQQLRLENRCVIRARRIYVFK